MNDDLGLKTLKEQGKLAFKTIGGDHMNFPSKLLV
jgi:hypothetical protein